MNKPREEKIITCPDCGGSGQDEFDITIGCPFCDGEGKVEKRRLRGTIFDETSKYYGQKVTLICPERDSK